MTIDRIQTLEDYADMKREEEKDIVSLPFKPEITMKGYTIELSLKDFNALEDYDYDMSRVEDCLFHILEAQTNVFDVEYHFGTFIYLKLEAKHDTIKEWKLIERVITDFIKKAKEYVSEE